MRHLSADVTAEFALIPAARRAGSLEIRAVVATKRIFIEIIFISFLASYLILQDTQFDTIICLLYVL